ncbi:hypothetical protein HPB48_021840 [Haemaphysalis longicornis]|uniref:Uncharacterized protein n=1 Tax=Haemaphysalis longicornis TaxID=44386 RepID=A0A9J6FV03_HAELO|nr:hypothetical protein HPB48_021840 [Haemaphysalis longicornis]
MWWPLSLPGTPSGSGHCPKSAALHIPAVEAPAGDACADEPGDPSTKDERPKTLSLSSPLGQEQTKQPRTCVKNNKFVSGSAMVAPAPLPTA